MQTTQAGLSKPEGLVALIACRSTLRWPLLLARAIDDRPSQHQVGQTTPTSTTPSHCIGVPSRLRGAWASSVRW